MTTVITLGDDYETCTFVPLVTLAPRARAMSAFSIRTYGRPRATCTPTGITVAPNGDFIICDNTDRTIKIFNKMGQLKIDFGTDQLTAPWNAVLMPNGNIAISDPDDHVVRVYTQQGSQVPTFNLAEENRQPCALHVNKYNSEILVADRSNNCIYRHDTDGFLLGTIQTDQSQLITTKTGQSQLNTFQTNQSQLNIETDQPELDSIQTDESQLNTIQTDQSQLNSIQTDESQRNTVKINQSRLSSLEYICTDRGNNTIVSDGEGHCVKAFDSIGQVKWQYTGRDNGGSQPITPKGVCCDRYGKVIFVDAANEQIVLLDADGRFEKVLLTANDGLNTPLAVAIDNDDQLVVTEGNAAEVKLFNYLQ